MSANSADKLACTFAAMSAMVKLLMVPLACAAAAPETVTTLAIVFVPTICTEISKNTRETKNG